MTVESSLNPIRYYTEFDPYTYLVDNRPLQDLSSNDTLIATALDSLTTVVSGISIDTTHQTGILKGNGSVITAATAGTDYVIPAGNVATATLATSATNATTATNLSG